MMDSFLYVIFFVCEFPLSQYNCTLIIFLLLLFLALYPQYFQPQLIHASLDQIITILNDLHAQIDAEDLMKVSL